MQCRGSLPKLNEEKIGFSMIMRKVNRVLPAILFIAIIIMILPLATQPAIAETTTPLGYWTDNGNYATTDPDIVGTTITIDNAAELAWVAVEVNNGNPFSGYTIKIANDIDLSAHYWVPIGNTEYSFQGIFDGNNKTISNLIIVSNSNFMLDRIGLFGFTSKAVIKNVSLINAEINSYVNSHSSACGCLLGFGTVTMTNCNATGNITGSFDTVGGLKGLCLDGFSTTITNCYASVNINASAYYIGGLDGMGTWDVISNSYATGNITGSDGSCVGGLFGHWCNTNNCFATGTVTGGVSSWVGGLGGRVCNVSNSYATGNVIGGDTSIVGGLCGDEGSYYAISNSFATGSVTGGNSSSVGGLCGDGDGNDVLNSYAAGSATGGDYAKVGGLVGNGSNITLNNCYAVGNVTTGKYGNLGGLMGSNSLTSVCRISNGYWNNDSVQIFNGTTRSSQLGVGAGTDRSTSKTSSEMKSDAFVTLLNNYAATDSTLKAWKFVSDSNNGYPMLNGVGNTATVDPVAISSLTPNATSPQPVNTAITWTCTATGGTELAYRFKVSSNGGTTWNVLADYSSENTYSWIPTTSGSYQIRAEVRDVNSTKDYDAYSEANYIVSSGAATGHTITGTISLPTGSTAPSGGINGYFNVTSESGNGITGQAFSIPSGSKSVAYTLEDIPANESGTGYKLFYMLDDAASNTYVSQGFYSSTSAGCFDWETATPVDLSSGDAGGINMTLSKGNSISGTISLPGSDTAPADGINLNIMICNANIGSINKFLSIPEGKHSLAYKIIAPKNPAGDGYELYYSLSTENTGYSDGAYAETVDVSSKNVSGINIQLKYEGDNNATAPTITQQPADINVNFGGQASLWVAAAVDSGTLSYQWYSNTKNSTIGGTQISKATGSTYSPPTTKAGTTYYYCRVTNTDNSVSGSKTATTDSNLAAVIVKTVANIKAPKITTQPSGVTVNTGETATLKISAAGSGTLSYQWYSNTKNSTASGTAISEAISSTYSVPTTTGGTTYYYCRVTNTDSSVGGTQTASTTSKAAKVVVKTLTNAAVPKIATQPNDTTVKVGGTASLTIRATVDRGTLSYQWYSNTENSTTGGTKISKATKATYPAPTKTAGTVYYYCLVTNTDKTATGTKTATTPSKVAAVVVN